MKVHGKIYSDVIIDPLDVLKKLKLKAIGHDSWIKEEDGKYYRCFELCRNLDDKEEITKELYDYVISLENIITYYNKNICVQS